MIISKPILSEVSDGHFTVDFLYDGHAVSTGPISKRLTPEAVKEEMTRAVQSLVDVRAVDNYEKIKTEIKDDVEVPDLRAVH